MDAVNSWISKNCRFAMSQEEARRVLQVDPNADMAAIQSAFRKMTLKYHPDKCPTPECHEEMIRINNAYDVLKGKDDRLGYGRQSAYEDFVREYGKNL
jgi:DnaJ-class molecular chaperone